jgi:hypothetical protein
VEWSLSGSPRVVNGRHRLWAAHRLPGVTALPLRIDALSVLPDALVDLGDEDYRVRIAQATRDELALVGATLAGHGGLAAVNELARGNVASVVAMIDLGRASAACAPRRTSPGWPSRRSARRAAAHWSPAAWSCFRP